MLTAALDGTPLKPFVLLKIKRPIKKIEDQFRNSLNLCWERTNWKNIPREALVAPIKTRDITVATDGSVDHLIHCIKPNGPIPSGRAALGEARILDEAALEEALVLDDEDAVLLDVSDSEGGEDSDSDASIGSESSSKDSPS
ncbi:pogo transposable element with KRAB domain-like protein [Aphelenchoides avenae]|nr:pogo transposable element with KRAB domain-like protein [Aphelenchus avenae]